MRRQPPVIALAALLSACGAAESPGPAITVTDSAGIVIVTNPGDDSGLPVWRVDTVPLLSIGLIDGDAPYLLDGVRYATTLGDGRIAIVNVGTDEVRLFDADGTHIRTFGGSGDGPGEYRFPARAWQRGDSLVVVDITANRITLQPIDGSSSRTVSGVSESRHHSTASLYAANSVILPIRAESSIPRPGESTDVSVAYVRLPLDGSSPDTLIVVPNGIQVTQQFDLGGGRMAIMVGPRLFESQAHAAMLAGRLVAGSAATPELFVIDPDLGTTRIIRWTGAATPVTADRLRTFIEERVAASDEPDVLRQRLEGSEYADSFPRFDAMLGGREGLWVRPFRVPGETSPHRWRVHDPDGRLIAVAEVPVGLTLYEGAPDRVLALATDEFDVQHVVVLPVRQVQ